MKTQGKWLARIAKLLREVADNPLFAAAVLAMNVAYSPVLLVRWLRRKGRELLKRLEGGLASAGKSS